MARNLDMEKNGISWEQAVSRLKPLDPERAGGRQRAVLENARQRLDMVPNFLKILSISPAAAEGYQNFSLALRSGILPARIREAIALLVAQFNGSEYSLAAHSALARMEGFSEEEIMDCRQGASTDSLTLAALNFTRTYLEQKGRVRGKDLDNLRRSGYEDEEVVEIMAFVALNIFTDYFNNAVRPELDFPPPADPDH